MEQFPVAFLQLLASVSPLMALQHRLLKERLPTLLADERPPPTVSHLMSRQRRLIVEALPTFGAHVGFLACMNLLMRCQC